jgi:sugar fermentation stimulation protein A
VKYEQPLNEGVLVRRYKRFLADIIDQDEREITIHCPNTGSMKNCQDEGSRIWYWDAQNPKRKYAHTWELVEVEKKYLACVNAGRANSLVREAIENGVITELQGYEGIRVEVPYGDERSRIDLLLERPGQPRCYVEVKNVTLLRGDEQGFFPDAVTQRGSKHLRELMAMVRRGERAVLVYCVAHTGIKSVRPADDLDSTYGETLREALAAGVEVLAYGAAITTEEICLTQQLPVLLG